jgi:hypothetical protein
VSQHQAFKRVAVPPQVASKQEMITFPAPTRGLIMSENESYMQPGAAVVCDNWAPTMKGAKIRGGHELWATLPSTTAPPTLDPATISNVTLSGGNLVATNTVAVSYNQGARVASASAKTSGKYYFEMKFTTLVDTSQPSQAQTLGIAMTSANYTAVGTVQTNACVVTYQGNRSLNGVAQGTGFGMRASGDVIGIALDLDASPRRIWFRIAPSGNWNNSGTANPATNVGGHDISALTGALAPIMTFGGDPGHGFVGNVSTANFGASAFTGAVPAGFNAGWVSPAPGEPIISAFQYVSGINHRMFFANSTRVYDVTTTTPVLVKSGQLDGNYSTSQMANAAGDYLIAVNNAGDYPLRFDGIAWTTLSADEITGPPGSAVLHGKNLVHVCKYRNRWFFIELNSMNAWYLGINSIGGALLQIPLSGAATKGGKLLYCATWSLDAGDGIDDKIVFGTDLGEIIVFTGSNPGDAANWRQEGRFDMSPPMGKNATLAIGGDLLVACVDGILPTSGAISKDRVELELAAVTRNIKPLWRENVLDKREWAWTMCKWDEYGGLFVTWPGGDPGKQLCAVANLATGAWTRYTGWDCTCFAKMRGDMFFGTQDGRIMQADRTGYDNGVPYVCTLVGGWEVFQSPAQTITWKQARASFSARASQPFEPLLSSTTDYVVTLPTPPPAPVDPGALDLWDQGLWDQAQWDAASIPKATVRHTGWVSIGTTGFSHAPVIQVTVAQQVKPEIELISIAGTFERLATTV